jgi:hypothetical protein
LHFLCTHCVQCACSRATLASSQFAGGKNVRVHAPYHALRGILFIIVHAQKFAATNFLNCTKNIELTARRFPRTVTLALTQKSESGYQDNNWSG